MENSSPRLFVDDEAVRRIGDGLVHCRLGREDWTHEAHIGACAYLLIERTDLIPERAMPGLIQRFNLSVGGVNDADQGYHETITQLFIRAVRIGLAETRSETKLVDRVNALLRSPFADREWPLSFYSKERLFSREARFGWIDPDLAALPSLPDHVR